MEQNGGPGGVRPAIPLELGGDNPGHVLKEDEGGLAPLDPFEDGGEEVPGVVVGGLPAAGAEGLAREAA
jgi:hypothetical protein